MCQKNQGPFREKMLENQQKLRKHEIDHSNRLNFWWVFLLFFFQRNSGFHLSIWTRFNMEKQHVTDLKEVGWWFFVGSFNSPNTKSEAPFLLFSGCFGDVVSHTLIPKNIGSSHPKSLKKPRMGLMDDELWGDDFGSPGGKRFGQCFFKVAFW